LSPRCMVLRLVKLILYLSPVRGQANLAPSLGEELLVGSHICQSLYPDQRALNDFSDRIRPEFRKGRGRPASEPSQFRISATGDGQPAGSPGPLRELGLYQTQRLTGRGAGGAPPRRKPVNHWGTLYSKVQTDAKPNAPFRSSRDAVIRAGYSGGTHGGAVPT